MISKKKLPPTNLFEKDIIKWRAKLKKEPEIAGWFIDSALMNEWDREFKHPVFHVLAGYLDKPIDEIDFLQLSPYEAVKLVMPKKLLENYDWSRFERARDPVEEGIPFIPIP